MKALGYIWKIAGGICFIIYAFILFWAPLFCNHGPMCDNDTSLLIFLFGSWTLAIVAAVSHIGLLPQPVNKRTLYRIDILLYILPFTQRIIPWIPEDLLNTIGSVYISPIATIVLAAYVVGIDRMKHRKEIQKAAPSKPKPNEISALFQTILNHKTEEVEAALAADPTQLNIPYPENGNTPLHVAVWNGYKDIVELLLKQPGIDTQIRNKNGKTALDLAQEKNFTDIIEMLRFTDKNF